ncbi:MAG: hypothetical protein IJ083_05815 [Clostridia bacterium]|nr:hypothetical protein [Clostridia bacterium]
MFVTIFLSLVICAVVTMMMIAAVAFIQDRRFFSSAPKEAQAVIQDRKEELFRGARCLGWVMLVLALLIGVGAVVVAALDGKRCGYGFWQFFVRFLVMATVYKAYDMIFFDEFLLLKFGFFQYFYPEAEHVLDGKKYGFNLKSQLLKLLIIFPAVSALAAFLCTKL